MDELLKAVFDDDRAADAWMHSPVPMLGSHTPAELVATGRASDVIAVLAGLASGTHA